MRFVQLSSFVFHRLIATFRDYIPPWGIIQPSLKAQCRSHLPQTMHLS